MTATLPARPVSPSELSAVSPAYQGVREAVHTTLLAMDLLREAGFDGSASERMALLILTTNEPLSLSELAAKIGLSRAAVTSLADRLELLGAAVRVPDPEDRRRTTLSITQAGHTRVLDAVLGR